MYVIIKIQQPFHINHTIKGDSTIFQHASHWNFFRFIIPSFCALSIKRLFTFSGY